MIDGELVTIIVNLLLVGGFLWWMLHPRHNNNEEPPVPKPLPKTGKMRCPMCGAEAKVTGKQWECPWCGDSRLDQIKFGYKTTRLNAANIKKNHLHYGPDFCKIYIREERGYSHRDKCGAAMREILFQEGRPMIITITLNAALDRTQRIEHPLQVGKLNRAVSSHLEPGGKRHQRVARDQGVGRQQYCA